MASVRAKLAEYPRQPISQHPLYNSAQAALERAQLDMARANILAPQDGTVSNLPKAGQYLRMGNLAMMLIATHTPWVEANFSETDITEMRVGQSVTVRVDAYPDYEWHGELESLSPGTGAEFSVIPAQNATGNWVKITQRVPVRIRLHATEQDQPLLRAGLSAKVKVDTKRKHRLSQWSF